MTITDTTVGSAGPGTGASAGTSAASAGTAGPTVRRLIQQQVLPDGSDSDVVSLYVDTEPAAVEVDGDEGGMSRRMRDAVSAAMGSASASAPALHPDQIRSRRSVVVRSGAKLSFGTYFNAFPASYWRRWTVVETVSLAITLRGPGATVVLMKSMANGRSQRVDAASTSGDESETFSWDLTLKPFVDGGWYWYDVVAGDADVLVEDARWTAEVPEERAEHGTVDLAITTMNRPDFCAKLLGQIGDDADLRPYLDEVLVMEQGKDLVTDSPEFPAAQEALGSVLRVIEQGNLGGSGGYARGQLESVRKGTATYLMCMDDDVICEPEGIIRAITFADLARRPTLVGGHMFSLYARSRLHSWGEVVQPWRFWWQSAAGVHSDWDFSARNLRSSRWLHKRVDVDFNGWFMCLIPRVVLEEIGLSLPVFIKWDDSEYGLRAKEAGYPTVSFPGAAVWHIPWTDKNDALDWQSYFHQRNRFVAALLHSPYPGGGRMVQESLNHQVKHLVSMQYSTVEIRHQALLDLLEGPEFLHRTLATRLPEIRAMAKKHTDARLVTDRDDLPTVKRKKPPRKGRDDVGHLGPRQITMRALKSPIRQFSKPRELSRRHAEAEIMAMDAQWFRLTRYDSAVVSMPDGTSAAFYQRDPAIFRDLFTKTVEIHLRLRREWPRLATEYRAALTEITSPEAWERTFEPWTDPQPATSQPDASQDGASRDGADD
ncbi:Galactofuranosyltransferase GlfT2 [Nocardioides aquaticus]|uniref:Galactofuranosyltransferase GlfT2 n=1 Tax=Nocardioides aquaticus TaxID=160826 RepID=A0ABX8EKN6_9ACTN|nr:glycosyltransferase [Nocardioides aquaticus]QVT80921.1 Galactofuranosyltransferase GlfT2 [Nocardioides aquaticus]